MFCKFAFVIITLIYVVIFILCHLAEFSIFKLIKFYRVMLKLEGGYFSVMVKCMGSYVGKIWGYLVYCDVKGKETSG